MNKDLQKHKQLTEEILKRVESFKEDMEKLGVDVKVTITVDLRRRP